MAMRSGTETSFVCLLVGGFSGEDHSPSFVLFVDKTALIPQFPSTSLRVPLLNGFSRDPCTRHNGHLSVGVSMLLQSSHKPLM